MSVHLFLRRPSVYIYIYIYTRTTRALRARLGSSQFQPLPVSQLSADATQTCNVRSHPQMVRIWAEYVSRTWTEKRRFQTRRSKKIPRAFQGGGQERSKGQPEKIARAPRAPREARRGPQKVPGRSTGGSQEATQEGSIIAPKCSQESPGKCPQKAEEAPKGPQSQGPTGPLRSALRSAQRKAEEGSGRAPRVAPECPQEELQEGPKRPQQERQNGTQKSTTAPGGLQQGTKQLPNMASRGGPERSKIA